MQECESERDRQLFPDDDETRIKKSAPARETHERARAKEKQRLSEKKRRRKEEEEEEEVVVGERV